MRVRRAKEIYRAPNETAASEAPGVIDAVTENVTPWWRHAEVTLPA